MSQFDLNKRAEAVRFILEKKNVKSIRPVRVGAAFDISGSAQPLYSSGVIQETVNRLLPVALRLDDNGELDMWAFHDGFYRLPATSAADYDTFVQKQILKNPNVRLWGATNYAPIMNDMVDRWFGSDVAEAPAAKPGFLGSLFGKAKPQPAPAPVDGSDEPALALFITDGAADDKARAEHVLRASQNKPVYWMLVGVGDPRHFTFLKDMAAQLPNVGFLHLNSLDITDDQLYQQLLSDELCNWVKSL